MIATPVDFAEKAAELQTALASVRLAVGALAVMWGLVILLGGALAKVAWTKLNEIAADVKHASDHGTRIVNVEREIGTLREWRHEMNNRDNRIVQLEEWRKSHELVAEERIDQIKEIDLRVRVLEQK